MAISTNFKIASRIGQMARNDTVTSAGSVQGSGAAVYDSAGLFPLSGNTVGDTAFTANMGDSAREYIFNGNGWYQINRGS